MTLICTVDNDGVWGVTIARVFIYLPRVTTGLPRVYLSLRLPDLFPNGRSFQESRFALYSLMNRMVADLLPAVLPQVHQTILGQRQRLPPVPPLPPLQSFISSNDIRYGSFSIFT